MGINATRLFSVMYRHTLNVGRVLSPTLALLVQREAEIGAFEPVPFYTVELDCGGVTFAGERVSDKAGAEKIAAACKDTLLIAQKVERKEKSEKAPTLYDLTTLQREANRALGYTAQQTLTYLQALYEKKLCTYPRTDSRYLTEDMKKNVPALAFISSVLCGVAEPETVLADQVCDNGKTIEEKKLDPVTKVPVLDQNGNAIMEEKEIEIPMFRPVKVFDVSQTEGKPLPQLGSTLTGDVQNYEIFMEALRRTSPVPISFKPLEKNLDGFFSSDSQAITLREGMSEVQTICAAVHEITHSLLHNREKDRLSAAAGTEQAEKIKPKDRNTEEVEAESVSYAVELSDDVYGNLARSFVAAAPAPLPTSVTSSWPSSSKVSR